MHPEAEIAAEFWRYINERGHGRGGEYYPHPPALMAELDRQYWTADERGDEETLRRYLVPTHEGPRPWGEFGEDDEYHYLPPTAFPMLQDALYDYLLADVGDLLIASNYELWLRAVAHILADAARDPSRLVIRVVTRSGSDLRDEHTADHTMAVSDDWSVLSRETFDFACRNYERNG